jgi:hypothetical protein
LIVLSENGAACHGAIHLLKKWVIQPGGQGSSLAWFDFIWRDLVVSTAPAGVFEALAMHLEAHLAGAIRLSEFVERFADASAPANRKSI